MSFFSPPRLRALCGVVGVWCALAAWLPAQTTVRDAELGRPQIRNWTMRDYEAFPQNWVTTRDADGRIYVGNRDGVLMYDGQAWRVLPVPGLFIRGLDFGPDGRLYVGGVDEFGYFERTGLGEWGAFVSLREQLAPEDRSIGDIRSVHALPDGVYFCSNRRLIRWREGGLKVWRFDGGTNVYAYRVRDRLYLHRLGDALRVVAGEDFTIAHDLPEIRAARLMAVLPWDGDGLLLVWTREVAELRAGVLTPWAPDSAAWLREVGIFNAKLLGRGHVAILTDRSGMALFTRDGAFVQRIDVASGLYNPIVRDVVLDTEQGLWLAMNHGVAHVDALAGITFFDAQNGLGRSTVRAVRRHEGTLYAATAEGLFRLRPGQGAAMARFELVPEGDGDGDTLYSHASGLLVGMRSGIYLYPTGGGPKEQLTPDMCLQLLPHPGKPDVLWVAGATGVYPLTYAGGRQWVAGPRLAGPRVESRSLAALSDGSLWASTATRGLLRWRAPAVQPTDEPEVFLESAGLPERHGWMRIDPWRDQLMASSRMGGLYRWDAAIGRFAPFAIVGGEGSMNVYGGDPNHLWSFFGKERQSAHVVRVNPAGAIEALPQVLVQAIGDVETLWRENHGGREILWVGGSYGLARVDVAEAFRPPGTFKTVLGPIERVQEPQWRNGHFVWPHGGADLAVHFAATTYRSGNNLQYQNLLEGYDRDWSPWNPHASRAFTNLSAGRYTLRVRARDADGRIGRETTLAFMVLPPWWGTAWAYVGYAVGAMLVVYGIVRWRVRAGERERERLQQLVTERTCQLVESQQSLRQAKEAAEAANRAKSAFLANMSHELRTPLNSVLGYAQILRRSPEVGPSARRSLETIQRSGDHLLHLINEVLDLAKVEAGRIELQDAAFAPGRFAQAITELFAVRAAEKGLEFSGPSPETLPAAVRGDEPRLRQVLVNLLGNAFKFTERGRIGWSMEAIAPDRWRIAVEDTGVGIAPAERARVFEPFYQSNARPALAQQGTGLGLSISAHLVQLMGGRLQVESEPGRGSRFWFEIALPVIEQAPAGMTEGATSDAALIVGYRGRRRRLLVVDDERSNRAILEEMLTPVGFIIEEADGADAARAAVTRQAPDAVLLDLRMPGDDGFTLAREWRESGVLLGAKVLALSASVLPEQQADALAAGCDAFLAKPFHEEQLLRVLGSLLGLEWLHSAAPDATFVQLVRSTDDSEVRWEAGVLRNLLLLAERGDALRLGQELAALARRGAGWAAIVAPWQKLAVGYQMEALSRALEATLQQSAQVEPR